MYYSITILVLCSALSHLSAAKVVPRTQVHEIDGSILSNSTEANVVPRTQVHEIDGIPNGIPVDITPFKKIGSKYYFIEESVRLNWFEAEHKCRQLGSHLLQLESEAEFNAVHEHLIEPHHYWTDVTDLGQSANYVSTTTGLNATFLKWFDNEPNNQGGNEHCVLLSKNRRMNDIDCRMSWNFVCESNSPRTVSIIVW